MLLVTPLNLLAPKWRKQYVLKDNPEHYSLGYYDFFEDKSHDGAIAATRFEEFLQVNGNFLWNSQKIVHVLEKKIVEILRMKPRVNYDFDDPAVTYLTGLEETFAYLDAAIDGCLKKSAKLSMFQRTKVSPILFISILVKMRGYILLLTQVRITYEKVKN